MASLFRNRETIPRQNGRPDPGLLVLRSVGPYTQRPTKHSAAGHCPQLVESRGVAISRGMRRASEQGRLRPPSEQAKMAMQLAARQPEAVAKSAKTRSELLTGRPQRMEGRSAAAEHNSRSKTYTVLTPDRVHYTFTNLNHFVRENAHLFNPEDVIWKPPLRNPWCRASRGLYSLFKETKPESMWKGWRGVNKSNPCDCSDHGSALLSETPIENPKTST